MKKVIHLWLVLTCVACAVLGVKVWLNKRQLAAQFATHAHSHAEFLRQQDRLRLEISAAEAEQKAGTANLSGAKPKKPTELSDNERFDRRLVKNDATEQLPEIRARSQRFFRRLRQKDYGDLYDKLNLQPENLEKFKQLLVDKQMTYSDAAALVAAHGISSFSNTGKNAVEQADQMVEHDIESLLGEKDYATYREYERVSRDVSRLQSFQGALTEKNVPTLDKGQLRALATACCDVADKERNPDYAAIAKDLGGTIATKQILHRSNAVLTPEQAQAYIAYREESDAAEKASAAFIRGEAPLPTPAETKSL